MHWPIKFGRFFFINIREIDVKPTNERGLTTARLWKLQKPSPVC